MRPEESDLAYLWDMLDAVRAISGFVRERGAVERHVEIIGEAAGRVSAAFREAHPEIPWRRIVAQRHVLAHEYGEIEHELIWKVATVHIPELIDALDGLVPPPLAEGED